jgi:hypothetical protein
MSELYLICHKVRGEPAFDIAERMICPECDLTGCSECDHLGYWWIIPTSGHRAYPWWSEVLVCPIYSIDPPPMPPDLPDHYRPKAEPKRTIDISALVKAKPFKMNRRI